MTATNMCSNFGINGQASPIIIVLIGLRGTLFASCEDQARKRVNTAMPANTAMPIFLNS